MKIFSAIFSLLLGTLSAADYYVSPTGSDSAPGTKGRPFATFKRALDALKAGDTLNMAPGDYAGAGCKTLRGTREKPIVIRAMIPGTVVIRGDKAVKGFKLVPGKRFIYAAPWHHQTGGVKERDTMTNYFPVNSVELLSYNRGAWFHDTGKKKLYIVTSDGKSPDAHLITAAVGDPKEGHGLQLLNNSCHVNFEGLNFTGFDSYVIKWGNNYYSVKSLLMNHANNIKVSNCRFFLNGTGLTFWNSQDCLAENCTAYGNYSLAVGSAANIYFTGGKTARCTARNCTAFNSTLSGVRFYSGPFPNCVIERCAAWGHGMSDLEIKAPDKTAVIRESFALKSATNTNVRNNIISSNSFRLTPASDPSSIYLRKKYSVKQVSENVADFDNFDGRPMSDSPLKGGLPYDKSVYYLSVNGSDSNAGTTIRAPRKSLKNIPDGATVYLTPGKYGKLVITQKNLTLAGRGRYTKALVTGLDIKGANVTVRKVNFSAPVAVKGSKITFENCSFASDLRFTDSRDFRVVHCAFVKGTVLALKSSGAVFSNIMARPAMGTGIYSDNNAYPQTIPNKEPRSIVCKALFNAPEKGDFTLKNAEAFAGHALDAFPIGPYNRISGGLGAKILFPRVHRMTPSTAELEWHLPTGKEANSVLCKSGKKWISNVRVSGEMYRNVTITGLKPGTKYTCRINSSSSSRELYLNIDPKRPQTASVTLEFTTPVKAAPAKEYFVAVNGSDTNPGTKGKPFRTISYALDQISPGDTVTVREGSYFEKFYLKVSDMTLRGMPGEKVWLDGRRKLLNIINFYNKRNITIDNLRMKRVITTKSAYIRCVNSSNVRMNRIFVDGRWSNGYSPTPLFCLSSKGVLLENWVTMNSFRGLHFIASDDITVRNCVLSMNSLNQIHFSGLGSRKALIEKNIICDIVPVKLPNALIHAEHTSPNLRVENNCFYTRLDASKRNFVGTWLGKGSGLHPMAHYRKAHPGPETNIFKDPVFPGLRLSKAPYTRNTVRKEYRGTADGKSWEVLDYKDFFPSDPEVRRRGMGLREAEVR